MGYLGAVLGGPEAVLWLTWASLASSWAILGRSVAIVGRLGAFLAPGVGFIFVYAQGFSNVAVFL